MTRAEFNDWWRDFGAKLPNQAAWLKSACERIQIDPLATLAQWESALSDVSLSDALDVNRKLLCGEIEPPKAVEQIVPLIRQHAWSNKQRHTRDYSEAEQVERFGKSGESPNLHGALAALLKMPDASREEKLATMTRLLPTPKRMREERFSCLLCLDGGRVFVWHPEIVKLAMSGDEERMAKCIYRTAVVPCSCPHGDRGRKHRENWPRYSPNDFCRQSKPDTHNPEAISELLDWAIATKEAYWQSRRFSEFDQWNAKGSEPASEANF